MLKKDKQSIISVSQEVENVLLHIQVVKKDKLDWTHRPWLKIMYAAR